MRFKKGTKVEVLSEKEVATGSWLCGEVISGNGHTFKVKYDLFPGTVEEVEKVPRKAIRPCPPPLEGVVNWVTGDVVEVFHNLCWQMASVVNVIDENTSLVRLVGTSEVFRVHKSHLRVRLCWQDGKWFAAQKGLEICGMPMGKRVHDTRTEQHVDDCCAMKTNVETQKPYMVSARRLKRESPFQLNVTEADAAASPKKRKIRKEGSHQCLCSAPSFKKVDAVLYPNELFGENNMHSSFLSATTKFSSRVEDRESDSFAVESSSVCTDSCASSVGSCSANCIYLSNSFRFSCQYNKSLDDYCSDAESSCGLEHEEGECSSSTDEIHRSELHAYHSALRTLYDSGLLSWEDEAKLTNLRLVLHISDDEHLMLVKDLVSAKSRHLFS